MQAKILLTRVTCGLLFTIPGLCSTAQEKPVCNSSQLGKFWPAEANADRKTLSLVSREGTLELCTRGAYRFHWKSLTVSYKDLLKEAKAKAEKSHKDKNPSDSISD